MEECDTCTFSGGEISDNKVLTAIRGEHGPRRDTTVEYMTVTDSFGPCAFFTHPNLSPTYSPVTTGTIIQKNSFSHCGGIVPGIYMCDDHSVISDNDFSNMYLFDRFRFDSATDNRDLVDETFWYSCTGFDSTTSTTLNRNSALICLGSAPATGCVPEENEITYNTVRNSVIDGNYIIVVEDGNAGHAIENNVVDETNCADWTGYSADWHGNVTSTYCTAAFEDPQTTGWCYDWDGTNTVSSNTIGTSEQDPNPGCN